MKFVRSGFYLLLSLFCFAAITFAQDTAQITGNVVDASGAVVPGATVTVTNPSIGVSRTVKSNAAGAYLVAGLSEGSYNLSVVAPGFKTFEANGIVLRVAENARVNVTLAVGEVSSKVVVEGANVAQVETQSSELGGIITGTQITQLELNGRNFTQLVTLIPGVSNQNFSSTGTDEGLVGLGQPTSFSFNGGREEYNNWEIDGGDNMDNGSNDTLNVYPSIDAISQVDVLTSNYSARYGRNASGTVDAEIKSGTSHFHGDVYEFARNDAFNANYFFNNAAAVPRPAYKRHDFGYTLGGPFYIPGHYNTHRDKTFFFWSQEWRRQSSPAPVDAAVPTVAERGGNFSDLCPAPASTQYQNTDTTDFPDCPVDPSTSLFFPNNQLPTPLNPNAQALLAEIPSPTPGVTNCGFMACSATSLSFPTDWREELIRVDHNINSKNRIFVHYIHDSWTSVFPSALWGNVGNSFTNIGTNATQAGTSAVLHLTTTASPSLLNEFVMSYTDDPIHLTINGNVQRPASMNMTGLFNNGFGGRLPGIILTQEDGTAFGGGFTSDTGYFPWNNANPTYTYRDDVVRIMGNHNLQFGAYVVFAQKNEYNSPDLQGDLSFDSGSAVTTDNAFADLLLGRIASYQQWNQEVKYYNRYKIVEPYFEDDWHVLPRLTLNLGLRLSLFGTYREKNDHAYSWEQSAYTQANQAGVDPGTGALINPSTGAFLTLNNPQVYNGQVQCGAAGVPAGCLNGHLFNPAPRIGFAWDVFGDGKTSLRGGYGVYFEHQNGNESNTESLEGSAPLVVTSTQPNIVGYTNIGGAQQVFPLSVTSIGTQARWPYVQQWNLDAEHEIMPNTVATIAYVGSKGTHLAMQRDLNQIVPVPAALNPYKPGQAIGPNDCSTLTTPSGVPVTGQAAINLNVACANYVTNDPYRPFLGFSDITSIENEANSSYNALQVSARRTKGPLVLSLAYTYSHSIDDASDRYNANFANSYNFAPSNRASSSFDERHMLNISYVYTFPNFRSNGWRSTFIGGWEISGITSFQTGTPITLAFPGLYATGDNAGVANGITGLSYPDIVGDPHAVAPASAPCVAATAGTAGPMLYNCAAFGPPQGLTFGNAGRNPLNLPHITNFDMALFKHFAIHESTAVEFRAEAFNVFNHTEWGGVDTTFNDPGFLHPSNTHDPRILQLGLKFLF